jgi:hypothetical protein
MEPPNGYSIDQLHAYAKANNYAEEARALQRYLELRRRREQGLQGRGREARRLGFLRVGLR